MKTLTLSIITIVLTVCTLNAQDITGKWHGIVEFPGTQLSIVFNIEKTGDAYTSTLDSPDQGAFGIPVDKTNFDGSSLEVEATALALKFKGELHEGKINGTFSQAGFDFPLVLSREAPERKALVRPQEPLEPYPYRSEDIIFRNNEAGINLAGTFTYPAEGENFPAVVLISGSGPQNRNEEVFGHKPFLVLSDYLTRNGIAVLRFDDRGFAESEGDHSTATSEDFAGDVESAVAYLNTRKEIDSKKIGLVGHSEGGLIAPMIAARNSEIAFIVLLAGPGMSGLELLPLQAELIARAAGTPETDIEKMMSLNKSIYEMVSKSTDLDKLKEELFLFFKNMPEEAIPGKKLNDEMITMQVNQLAIPWMHFFMNHNPVHSLEKVKCPVLAVNGEKDLQVPPKENLSAIEAALKRGGNKNVTIIEFPGLNHMFQECKTGSPSEYSQIEQTFAPVALETIGKWISEQTE